MPLSAGRAGEVMTGVVNAGSVFHWTRFFFVEAHRRHLTTSQRAAIAAQVLPMLSEEALQRKRTGAALGGELAGRGLGGPSAPCRSGQSDPRRRWRQVASIASLTAAGSPGARVNGLEATHGGELAGRSR